VSWYLTDNIASIRQIVSINGSVLDQLTYGTFGSVLSETNSANGDRFKYACGEYDSVLGEYRYGVRYYSPTDGRWLSQDPLGLKPDTNPYRYVGNHPVQSSDPAGLLTSCNTPQGAPSCMWAFATINGIAIGSGVVGSSLTTAAVIEQWTMAVLMITAAWIDVIGPSAHLFNCCVYNCNGRAVQMTSTSCPTRILDPLTLTYCQLQWQVPHPCPALKSP
jgi:RHS repeat-associated protein